MPSLKSAIRHGPAVNVRTVRWKRAACCASLIAAIMALSLTAAYPTAPVVPGWHGGGARNLAGIAKPGILGVEIVKGQLRASRRRIAKNSGAFAFKNGLNPLACHALGVVAIDSVRRHAERDEREAQDNPLHICRSPLVFSSPAA